MNKLPTQDWLNLSEAARLLGVHPSTIRLWADKGELPSQRTSGGHRRFRRVDLEGWAASRRRGAGPGASLVVQSALGRARIEVSEGQLARQAWYGKLSDSARVAYRETSQRLLALLKKYLTTEEREATLTEARRLGIEYYRLGKLSHLSLSESARAFLYFREFVTQSAVQIVETANPAADQAVAELYQLTSQFTNEILIAMIGAHESAA
jgi:excisionase family DNA binding protein